MRKKIVQNNKPLQPALARHPEQALRQLIQTSQGILNLTERESKSLAQNDLMTFAILQNEKEAVAAQYKILSESFRERLEDFRSADKNLLSMLEKLQKQIGERTQDNNRIVSQMRTRALKSTQGTLITAQELGQSKLVTFAETAR